MQVNIFYWFLFFIFFVSFTLQVILLNSHLSKHEIVICDKKDPELRPYLLKTKRFFFFFSSWTSQFDGSKFVLDKL